MIPYEKFSSVKQILSILLENPFKTNSQILDPDKWVFCIVSIIESVDELSSLSKECLQNFHVSN